MRTTKQVLGYGERSRLVRRVAVERAVAAERARCAAVCREVADAHAADYGGEYGAALECAAAILRGPTADAPQAQGAAREVG